MRVTRIDWFILSVSALLLALLVASSFYDEVPTPLFVLFVLVLAVGIGLSVAKHLRARRRRRSSESSDGDSTE